MEKRKESIFKRPYVVTLLGLFSCFLWGSALPSIKVGYDLFNISGSDTYGKMLFAGYRFFLSGVMVILFALVTGRKMKLKKHELKEVTLLGFMRTAVNYALLYIGVSNTSGTKSSILTGTGTLFSLLLAHFFYKEDKLTNKKILGLILGFSGVVIVNINGGSVGGGFSLTGEGFILLASLTNAIAGIYTKKLAKDIDTFLIAGYQLLVGSVFLLVAGYLGGAKALSFTGQNIWLLLYLAFISAAAMSIWTILLKYNGVGKVTIYKFTIPIFGTFLSYIFLNERFLGTNVLLAIGLVSFSVILINIDEIRGRSKV